MKIYVGTMNMSAGNLFSGENMMVFNNLKRKPVKTTLYSLFNLPSVFIEGTLLSPGILLRFSQSLARNSFRGTKKQSDNLSYWVS